MSNASQVTVEQLLIQQKLRDDTIRFLQNENVKLLMEINLSLINNQKLIAIVQQLKWQSSMSNN